jgi:nitrate/TMAO reductase-like tetraheme cytochrome c subunit
LKSTNPESLKEVIKETKIISKLLESGTTCLLCFENNPFVIEWHHIGGKNNSSETIPLCANCHVLASKHQLTYDKIWKESKKSNILKLLFIQKDLQFLQDRINQRIIDELRTD